MQIASRRSSLTTSNVALGRRQSVSDRGRAGAYLFKFGFPLSSASSLLLWKNAQLGFFLLVAAALAVLSASFARTVLLTIGTVIITLSIFFVVMQGGSATAVALESLAYPVLAMLAVVAVGALCVIAFQYRFRVTPVAAVIGVATILGCALVVRFWPQSLTAYLSHRNDSPMLQSVQLLPDANLRDLPQPYPAQDAGDQARTAYYPFRAVGLAALLRPATGLHRPTPRQNRRFRGAC